jgi:hypothetical protein
VHILLLNKYSKAGNVCFNNIQKLLIWLAIHFWETRSRMGVMGASGAGRHKRSGGGRALDVTRQPESVDRKIYDDCMRQMSAW